MVSPLLLHHLLFPPISPSLFSLSHSYLHLDIISRQEERPLMRCCQPGGRASTGQMTGRHAQCTAQLYTQQHNRSRALPPLQNYRAGAAETAGAVILLPCSWISFEAIMIIALLYLL